MTLWCSTNRSLYRLPSRCDRQRGSALLVALFVIVVMALLGAGLSSMIQDTSRNAAWEVLGTRANLAAASGLEQALSELFPLNLPNPADCADVNSNPTLTGEGFANCRVQLRCNRLAVSAVGLSDTRFFDLSATASCGAGGVAVQRSQRVQTRSSL
ncbi:hypothetical protein [Agarivorans sp. QJM3NY_33]|uniref:hypothetical protein n=1 Tax=Agarivorans sp. QJM3NY_33 TaxID=3421432 RepID=UPI003D7E5F8B